jgi:hypothetical protein
MKIRVASAILLVLLAGCSAPNPRAVTTPNHAAELRGNLPADPLLWRVITPEINRSQSTMSTLVGNDLAVDYARTHADANYPTGSVLALVTWSQQEDTRWFGANIPSDPRSVEFLTVSNGPDHKPFYAYRSYKGAPLTVAQSQDSPTPQGRTAWLLAQRAAVLP